VAHDGGRWKAMRDACPGPYAGGRTRLVRAYADPRPHRRRPGARQGAWVRFGRPKKLAALQRRGALDRIDAGEAVAEVARTFGIDRATVYRLKG
jgi:DNA invertase Pin-like site-specific DNA recombinase